MKFNGRHIFNQQAMNDTTRRDERPKLHEPGKNAVNIRAVQKQKTISNNRCKFCGDEIIWKKSGNMWTPLNKESGVTHVFVCKRK